MNTIKHSIIDRPAPVMGSLLRRKNNTMKRAVKQKDETKSPVRLTFFVSESVNSIIQCSAHQHHSKQPATLIPIALFRSSSDPRGFFH
jgi:hypothetical protein